MKNKIYYASILVSLLFQVSEAAPGDLEWEVGLSANRTVIRAQGVRAGSHPAPTVLYLAGLTGESDASEQIRSMLDTYSQLDPEDRPVDLIVIPIANPERESLIFPPDGSAYAENSVANALWRWLGVHAPDLVVVAGEDEAGLAQALEGESVAGIGSIPVRRLTDDSTSMEFLLGLSLLEESPASVEVGQRLKRTPAELTQQLAESYGYEFSSPVYVPGMSLIGRMRLGYLAEVEQLIQGYLAGEAIEVSNASIMAGQLVFAEHAELTGNEKSLQLAINAADLAFDDQGNMRQAMPMHNEMSDSVFMATPLLMKAGKLTGQPRYFDMAVKHSEYMRGLLLRDDGLYRHSPLAEVAWGRGNAFPALGLALSLSDLPDSHPAYDSVKQAFIQHMETLRMFQDIDGMWREVIDYPGSFPELTATAMIGTAIKRGLDRGWLSRETYQPILASAWDAVLIRTSMNGEFIDVCTSTGKLQTVEAYLDRLAIIGRDDRAGGMVMNLAIEMIDNRQ